MNFIQIVTLLMVTETAVLCDLARGRIPNELILAGLVLGAVSQSVSAGIYGVLFYLGGVLLPVVALGPLYYFRMIGAGDIKLLSVAGGFMGPAACVSCMFWSAAAGGILAAARMLRSRNLIARLSFFAEYVEEYARTGRWKPYLKEVDEDAKFCFSAAILAGVLICIGKAL